MKKLSVFLFITFSLNVAASIIDLQDLKKGSTSDVFIGTTSGLVNTSIDSVNELARTQRNDYETNKNRKGNWKYTVECTGTTFSGIPKRAYSGVIQNSSWENAYSLAQREQQSLSCYKRFGNGYSGDGYLNLELE